MKKIILIACILISTVAHSQYYSEQANSKHFVGFGYSLANTHWYSHTEDFQLFDPTGRTLIDGAGSFDTRVQSQMLQLEVLAPVGEVRMGVGIAFEECQLYKINVESDIINTVVPFTEMFRFNKLFYQLEVPFSKLNSHFFSLAINNRVGYYGFTAVKSLSLFGERRMGKSFFGSTAARMDFKVGAMTYLFVMPMMEYKYFKNTQEESPNFIIHNMFSYSAVIGLRFHVV